MGQMFEEMKIKEMSYNQVMKAIKESFDNQFQLQKFEEILDNFKKFNEEKRITKFPLDTLKKLLIGKKKDSYFDLIVETKKEYFLHFKKYYKSHSSSCGPFADIFKNTKDYEELLKEQYFYLQYKEFIKTYKEDYELSSLSFSFRIHICAFIRLQNNETEWIKYLEEKTQDEFPDIGVITSSNLREKQTKFFEYFVEKDLKKYSTKPKSYYEEDDDDDYNNNNYSYDNKISYDNYDNYDNDNNSYEYRPNHTSSSSYRRNYNSTNSSKNSNSNQSKKNSNTKNKVKVIICYSCKGKKKCPLCGNQVKSLVSLGNLYAHSDCYKEGTCCLCNKKGAGNHVQSICSDCRKSSASKGLTGSARCFICRKLI